MRTFQEYIAEAGGKKPGKLELTKTDVKVAKAYAREKFADYGFDLDVEIPMFEQNYATAKAKAMFGRTKRREMPVLENPDIRLLQNLLKRGSIDIQGPYSSEEVAKDPFPEGLKGSDAQFFLERGLRIHDGSKPDDIVRFKKGSVAVSKLQPIQEQIYVDKSINRQSKEGAKISKRFMQTKSTFVCSSDLKIIDGHHRWLSSTLLDQNMKVKILMIDLPIDKLLPLTVAFSDAVGNKRNG